MDCRSSSWLHLVEQLFVDMTVDCVREGSLTSVQQLTEAITASLAEQNQHPKPYRWTASRETIPQDPSGPASPRRR